jgi:hypothetical protein
VGRGHGDLQLSESRWSLRQTRWHESAILPRHRKLVRRIR